MITIFFIALGLAMDAFAVSICQGLKLRKLKIGHATIIALTYGLFQGLMPVIGYLLGAQFERYITAFDHWIAFILLGMIGLNMIKEALSKDEEDSDEEYHLNLKEQLVMGLATSIDALVVGITFAFLKTDIILAASSIASITFIISFFGVYIGHFFGAKFKSKAELAGGLILILMGLKILLEHLGIL